MLKRALRPFKATKMHCIYIMHAKDGSNFSNTYQIQKHSRLTHVSINGLKFLNDKGVFGKDLVFDIPFCNHFVIDKHSRMSFVSSTHKKSRALKYVHTNLWGPRSNPTFGGNKYSLSIIDDFSRRVWIYLLKDMKLLRTLKIRKLKW